jgi:hypothetical protein
VVQIHSPDHFFQRVIFSHHKGKENEAGSRDSKHSVMPTNKISHVPMPARFFSPYRYSAFHAFLLIPLLNLHCTLIRLRVSGGIVGELRK